MRRGFVLATTIVFAALSLAWLHPLLRTFATGYLAPLCDPTPLGRADAMLTSWMLAWSSHALRTNPLGLFDANIFHPLRWTFAFSENLIASSLLVLPIDLVIGDPVVDHNALVVLSFVLNGVGTALLVRELGAGLPAAWLAGVLVAFNPFRFGTIGHVHALSTHWMPFALLALVRCLRRGRGAILVATTTALVALSSVYYAYFWFLAAGVFLLAHWALRADAAPGGRRRALAGVAVAGVVTMIMLLPDAIARDVYALAQDPGQAVWFQARGVSYLGALADPLGYVRQRYVVRENTPTVLGLAMLPLAVLGLAAARDRRMAGAICVTALAIAAVSLGPLMQWQPRLDGGVPGPWALLARVVPGWSALRVPARASTIVVLAAAVLAAFGADALWRRAGRARPLVVLLLLAAAALEGWRPRFEMLMVPWAEYGPPPVYDWLDRLGGNDAVVELPIGRPANDAASMVMSATHWRPLVNGYSGFEPTMPFFRRFLEKFPDTTTDRLLRDIGVRWVVVHPADGGRKENPLCGLVLAPHMTLSYRDGRSCVFELLAFPPRPTPQDWPLSLSGTIVTASDGSAAVRVLDGDGETDWTQAVDPSSEGWLQLDLPAPRTVSRLVVTLGSHFGEYLRRWRLDVSDDGKTWRSVASEQNAVPPFNFLPPFNHDHDLTTEIPLDRPVTTRHLRIIRPAAGPERDLDLWASWRVWGVHEVILYEPLPVAAPAGAG